jgi:serine/threonine-protein kinase
VAVSRRSEDLSASGNTSPPPRRLGNYLLLERLSHGGMGDVWLARQSRASGIEKFLVVKTVRAILDEDSEVKQRFLDEARTVVQLSHSNICSVLEVGETEDEHFLVMDLIAGFDLREVFLRTTAEGGVGEAIAVQIVAEILDALDYAHRLTDVSTGEPLHLVHRDVSLHNAMLTLEGEVKLIDFGLARSTLKKLQTQTGIVLGKIAYMSSEQARGENVDGRTDQFSAAVVFYELLTGERYYGDRPQSFITEHVGTGDYRPTRIATLAPPLRAVVERALSPNVADRFPSASAMRKALVAARAAPAADSEDIRALLARFFPDANENHRARMARASELAREANISLVETEPSRRAAPSTLAEPVSASTTSEEERSKSNSNPTLADIALPPAATTIADEPSLIQPPATTVAVRERATPAPTTRVLLALAVLVAVAAVAVLQLRPEGKPRASEPVALPPTSPVVVEREPNTTPSNATPPNATLSNATPSNASPSNASPPLAPPRPTTPATTATTTTPAKSEAAVPTIADDAEVPLEPVPAETTPRHSHRSASAPRVVAEKKASAAAVEPVTAAPKRPPLPTSPPAALPALVRVLEASCIGVVSCASGIHARFVAANQEDVAAVRDVRAAAERCFDECRSR